MTDETTPTEATAGDGELSRQQPHEPTEAERLEQAAKDELERPTDERRESEIKMFCNVACGHLAKLGCHDSTAKAVIEAIARTMAGRG